MRKQKNQESKLKPLSQQKESKKTKTKKKAAAIKESEGDDTDGEGANDLISYLWSGVMSLSYRDDDEFETECAEIDPEHSNSNIKVPRGRPNTNWDFIFSPAQFDESIDLTQFQANSLSVEEMKNYAIRASLVRQDILDLSLKLE